MLDTPPLQKSGLKVLLASAEIPARVRAMGREISRAYDGEPLLLLGVLKGAAIFLADLARNISLDCTFDFPGTQSYGSNVSSVGNVRLTKDTDVAIAGKNVLLVEDVLDSGNTVAFLLGRLACIGFTIADQFVVGYGMDYGEHYRNLPTFAFSTKDPARERCASKRLPWCTCLSLNGFVMLSRFPEIPAGGTELFCHLEFS